MPINVALNELTKDDLKRILNEPKNAIIKQFVASFAIDDVKIEFTDDAIDAIAEMAIQQKQVQEACARLLKKCCLIFLLKHRLLKAKRKLL